MTSASGRVITMLLVSLVGACIYFAPQSCMRAPQVQWVKAPLLERWRAALNLAAGAWRRLTSVWRRWLLNCALLLAPPTVGALAALNIKYAVAAVLVIAIIGWVMV